MISIQLLFRNITDNLLSNLFVRWNSETLNLQMQCWLQFSQSACYGTPDWILTILHNRLHQHYDVISCTVSHTQVGCLSICQCPTYLFSNCTSRDASLALRGFYKWKWIYAVSDLRFVYELIDHGMPRFLCWKPPLHKMEMSHTPTWKTPFVNANVENLA